MADDNNVVVWEGTYPPFGNADISPSAEIENNFRFAGQYYDQETGLHYNYHRYYDPATGRYITPDPIGLDGGFNLYSYVGNNQKNSVDPLGLLTEAYHEATGGGWKAPPKPPYGGGGNMVKNLYESTLVQKRFCYMSNPKIC